MAVFADILSVPGNIIRWPGKQYSQIKQDGIQEYLYRKTAKNAIGTSRSYMTSYVILKDIETKAKVGSFVLGLYQLAEIGLLSSQQALSDYIDVKTAENADYEFDAAELRGAYPDLYSALFRETAGGEIVQKTPFELAVLSTTNAEQIIASTKTEYAAQYRAGGRIPQPYFRARLGDFLNADELKKIGLKTGKSFSPDITLPAKAFPPSRKEELLHYFAQWMATIMTTSALMLAGTIHPVLAVVGIIALWKNKHSDELSWWSTAESFLQDANWLSRDNFSWKKLSYSRVFNFALTVAMLGFFAYIGGMGMHQAVMGLSGMLPYVHEFLAVTSGIGVAIGTFWGTVGSIRMLSNWLSVNNNTISLSEDLKGTFTAVNPESDIAPTELNDDLRARVAQLEGLLADNGVDAAAPAARVVPVVSPGLRVLHDVVPVAAEENKDDAMTNAAESTHGTRRRRKKRT